MTVRTLCWLNTRSTATTSGLVRGDQPRRPRRPARAAAAPMSRVGRRCGPRRRATSCSGRPGAPSTTPMPHRVRPGSTPSTRTGRPTSVGASARTVVRAQPTVGVAVARRGDTRASRTFAGCPCTPSAGAARGAVRPSPLFLAVVARRGGRRRRIAWAAGRLPGSRWATSASSCSCSAPGSLSLCLHEFAHAYAAYRAGDRSVEARGYLTLNPLKYAHRLLSIILPLFAHRAGRHRRCPAARSTCIAHAFRSRAQRRARRRRRPADQRRLRGRAHPGSRVAPARRRDLRGDGRRPAPARSGRRWRFLGFLQLTAAVLNLLPVPGLDGCAIIEPYLDPQTVQVGEKIKPWGLLGVIVLLLYVTPVKQRVLRPGERDLSRRRRPTGRAARASGTRSSSSGRRTRCDAGATQALDGLEDLVADVEVGVDVLHVVEVLERVDQPEHLARAVLVERHLHARQERHVGRLVVDAGVLQRGAHRRPGRWPR